METRRIWRFLGGAAIALLLAGCFRVNMDLEVAAENTVSGTAVIAVDESLLELSGQSVDDLFADMDLSDLPAGSTSERVRRGRLRRASRSRSNPCRSPSSPGTEPCPAGRREKT